MKFLRLIIVILIHSHAFYYAKTILPIMSINFAICIGLAICSFIPAANAAFSSPHIHSYAASECSSESDRNLIQQKHFRLWYCSSDYCARIPTTCTKPALYIPPVLEMTDLLPCTLPAYHHAMPLPPLIPYAQAPA